jgi:hypothetical protein
MEILVENGMYSVHIGLYSQKRYLQQLRVLQKLIEYLLLLFLLIFPFCLFFFSSLGLSGGKTKTKYLEREVERAKILLNNQEEEEDDGDEEEFFFHQKKNILKLQTQKGRANGHFCCGTRLESNFMKNLGKILENKTKQANVIFFLLFSKRTLWIHSLFFLVFVLS